MFLSRHKTYSSDERFVERMRRWNIPSNHVRFREAILSGLSTAFSRWYIELSLRETYLPECNNQGEREIRFLYSVRKAIYRWPRVIYWLFCYNRRGHYTAGVMGMQLRGQTERIYLYTWRMFSPISTDGIFLGETKVWWSVGLPWIEQIVQRVTNVRSF